MKSVRGAVFIGTDNENEIMIRTCELYRALLQENKISEDEIVNLIISVTDGITALNPCTALRKENLAKTVPLFCVQEAQFKNSASLCIRFLLTVNKNTDLRPVYLNGAQILRPDLF